MNCVALNDAHQTDGFASGVPALDIWLKKYARHNQAVGQAQTYVIAPHHVVAGYYALAAGSVEHGAAPGRIRKGLARSPIPVVLLARLAVDSREQGKGLGAALLKDALLRVAGAAELIGVRALLVHAKDSRARGFYERYDFEQSPVDDLQLFLLLKDLRRSL